jgi:hypothetical protein
VKASRGEEVNPTQRKSTIGSCCLSYLERTIATRPPTPSRTSPCTSNPSHHTPRPRVLDSDSGFSSHAYDGDDGDDGPNSSLQVAVHIQDTGLRAEGHTADSYIAVRHAYEAYGPCTCAQQRSHRSLPLQLPPRIPVFHRPLCVLGSRLRRRRLVLRPALSRHRGRGCRSQLRWDRRNMAGWSGFRRRRAFETGGREGLVGYRVRASGRERERRREVGLGAGSLVGRAQLHRRVAVEGHRRRSLVLEGIAGLLEDGSPADRMAVEGGSRLVGCRRSSCCLTF